ncbi:hypothetical protein GCM10009765_48350 [Fodinicola feengrottensis]|uniref:Uncharacterized protein n=1 Tax=Fodinicola feengrottensis TaxID=435914 RepID=A0ABN2HTP4_9ACTN
MSITKLSDAMVRWLVPQTTAAACIQPDGCDACRPNPRVCYNHRWTVFYYQHLAYNCLGQCVLHRTTECKAPVVGGTC